jgi:hypothetical protein
MMTWSRLLVPLCVLVAILGADVARAEPPWSIACGDGRVDTIFDAPWTVCCTTNEAIIPRPVLRPVPGCNGPAVAVDYDLRNIALVPNPLDPTKPIPQSWVVLQQAVPQNKRNFTKYTHVRLAVQGSNGNSHETLEVKLNDGSGLFTARLASVTDLPVWRAIYVDLREFTGTGTINLANIVGLEIGIARCPLPAPMAPDAGPACEVPDNSPGGPSEEHVATLFLGEFAGVDLKPGAPNRLVETGFAAVTPNPSVRAEAAAALLGQLIPCGPGQACDPGTDLIPAWFPETNRNLNTYVQAEALLVFVSEYERTGNPAFRDAAQRLATKLLGLQIPAGKVHAGAWYTSRDAALNPPGRALPTGNAGVCDGNETMVQDPDDPDHRFVAANIDACEYVGNVGWALIALGKLRRSGFYPDAAALQNALDRGAAWIAGQSAYRRSTADPNPLKAYPNLISLGTEANISAYFGLSAAGKRSEAVLLGDAIFKAAWDPVQRRIKPGVRPEDAPTAIDVSGSWGVTFLRSIGRPTEARDSQAYSASVMRVSSFDGSIFGYGDIAGPYTPAVEFTAQAAAAGISDADFAMQQISPLRARCTANYGHSYPGAFPGAADHWYGGQLSPWSTTMCGVSPTAWVYFAQNGDPLLDLLVPRLSLSVNQAGFRSGQTLILSGHAIPGPIPLVADVYVGLLPPGCGALGCVLFWQGALNFATTPQPIVRNAVVSAFDGTMLSYTFAGGEPAGGYVWVAAFAEPGTLNLIGPIAQTSFTFAR